MKKLSFSLFAVLAIVFAIASAFTTRPHKTSNFSTQQVWGIPENIQVSSIGSDPADRFDYLQSNATEQSFSFEGLFTDLDDYLTNNTDGVSCAASSGYVCLALVQFPEDIVVDISQGDFVDE